MESLQSHSKKKLDDWRDESRFTGMKILVVDDDPISRTIIKNFLAKKPLEIQTAKNGREALDIIAENPEEIAVLLADWMMPEMNGPDLIQKVRELKHESYIYSLLLTARDAKKDIVIGFQSGADDYVTKPPDLQELWARISTGLRMRLLMLELAKKNRMLSELALKDPLTDLLNRRAMESVLDKEISRAARKKFPFGVAMADIDFFKHVNDTYGHQTGDVVLKRVAQTLRDNIRVMDTIARFGGEEFLMIFPETEESGCRIIGERLRNAIEELVFDADETSFNVTISIGFAYCTPQPPEKIREELVALADEALYKAKQTGRNRFVIRRYPG